ncbi:hypothetical protein [Staphylococcus pettenkoferi]|uniref:hypothetical protein n=1 Tax=Staphylococcus pettenkoferi TaxID=170573 RepID=UPI002556C3DF|nr:hypothetical protein [Staphylococcus pettenkoferi]MDK7284464.1 hypothetical protein [Staphylococcus pettenkoferi]
MKKVDKSIIVSIISLIVAIGVLIAFNRVFDSPINNVIKGINKQSEAKTDYKLNYHEFSDKTKTIDGKVAHCYKHQFHGKHFYYFVVNDKLIKVKKGEYKKYQKGDKVNFRISKENQNTTILDLNKRKDIKNKRDYQAFIKDKDDDEKDTLFTRVTGKVI